MKKRILALFLTLCMLLGAAPAVFAGGGTSTGTAVPDTLTRGTTSPVPTAGNNRYFSQNAPAAETALETNEISFAAHSPEEEQYLVSELSTTVWSEDMGDLYYRLEDGEQLVYRFEIPDGTVSASIRMPALGIYEILAGSSPETARIVYASPRVYNDAYTGGTDNWDTQWLPAEEYTSVFEPLLKEIDLTPVIDGTELFVILRCTGNIPNDIKTGIWDRDQAIRNSQKYVNRRWNLMNGYPRSGGGIGSRDQLGVYDGETYSDGLITLTYTVGAGSFAPSASAGAPIVIDALDYDTYDAYLVEGFYNRHMGGLYHDANAYSVLKFTYEGDPSAASLFLPISNQYSVLASSDNRDYSEIARNEYGGSITSHDLELDLTGFLGTGAIYVRIQDSIPTDGNGAYITGGDKKIVFSVGGGSASSDIVRIFDFEEPCFGEVNTADQIDGSGCVTFFVPDNDVHVFTKWFDAPIDLSGCDYVEFWFYISDVSRINGFGPGQIELTSSGTCDREELAFDIRTFSDLIVGEPVDGWNLVRLNLRDPDGDNGFIPENFNYFRMYTIQGDLAGTTIGWDMMYARAEGTEAPAPVRTEAPYEPEIDYYEEFWSERPSVPTFRLIPTDISGAEYLGFDLFVEDAEAFYLDQIEFSSHDMFDWQELCQNRPCSAWDLHDGWNTVVIPIHALRSSDDYDPGDGSVPGFDYTCFRRIRMYNVTEDTPGTLVRIANVRGILPDGSWIRVPFEGEWVEPQPEYEEPWIDGIHAATNGEGSWSITVDVYGLNHPETYKNAYVVIVDFRTGNRIGTFYLNPDENGRVSAGPFADHSRDTFVITPDDTSRYVADSDIPLAYGRDYELIYKYNDYSSVGWGFTIDDYTDPETGIRYYNGPNGMTMDGTALHDVTDLVIYRAPNGSDVSFVTGFSGKAGLRSVVVNRGVRLDDNAFSDCADLETVEFMDWVMFGQTVFSGCTSLQSVYFAEDCEPASQMFRGCSSLETIWIRNSRYPGSDFRSSGMSESALIYTENGNTVYDIYGNWIPSDRQITILSQPMFTHDIYLGEPAMLSVNAAGSGLTYRWWYYSGGWQAVGTDSPEFLYIGDRSGGAIRCTITDENGHRVMTDDIWPYIRIDQEYYLYLTVRPRDCTAVAGGQGAAFFVYAEGLGLAYQWQKRNADGSWTDWTGSDAQESYIIVPAVTEYDGAAFRCLITDAYGNMIVTAPVTMTLVRFAITEQPQNVTVQGTEAVHLEIGAEGDIVRYEWRIWREGGNVLWAEYYTDTPWIDLGLEPYPDFICNCTVVHQNGSTLTSDFAEIRFEDPIVIYEQPCEYYLTVCGDSAWFYADASGFGWLEYEWQYRMPGDPDWSVVGYGSTLCLSVALGEYFGAEFRCRISDRWGNVVYTDTAELHQFYIYDQTDRLFVDPGTVYATVSAVGSGLTYQWQYSADGGMTWKNSTAASAKSSRFSINARAAIDGYLYRCLLVDEKGTECYSDVIELRLITPITQVSLPETFAVSRDEDIFVYAEYEGTYADSIWEVRYPWDTDFVEVTYGADYFGFHSMFETWDGAVIRCTMIDFDGNAVVSNEMVISVCPIRIEWQTEQILGMPGEWLGTEVYAYGPVTGYQWQICRDGMTWTDIEGAESAYYFWNMQESDVDALLRCAVFSDGWTLYSREIPVVKYEWIRFVTQPKRAEIGFGEAYTLIADVTGSIESAWWEYLTPTAPTWEVWEGGNDGRLTVYGTEEIPLAAYRFVVCDILGQLYYSDNAEVCVCDDPMKIIGIEGPTIRDGVLTFSVETNRPSHYYEWQWQYPGEYYWYCFNSETANSDTLLFTEYPDYGNPILIRCVVSSERGGVVSDAVLYEFPRPVNYVGSYGRTELFMDGNGSCDVYTDGTVKNVVWYLADPADPDHPVEFAKGSLSVIVPHDPSLNGMMLYCTAEDYWGETYSTEPVTIRVYDFRIYELTEGSYNILENDGFELYVNAEGNIVSYRWEKNTPDGFVPVNAPDANSAHCIIDPELEAARGGEYRCVITDVNGIEYVSELCVLNICTPFAIVDQPEELICYAGKRVEIRIEYTGTVYDFVWFTYRSGLEPLPGDWYFLNDGGRTYICCSAVLDASYDGLTVYARIYDPFRNEYSSDMILLRVLTPLTIVEEPADIVTRPGSVTSSVIAEGDSLTYQWYYSKNGGETWVKATAATAKTAAYTVNARADLDGYLYHCVITDGMGNQLTTATASLTIGTPLRITEQTDHITTRPGSVVFSVNAEGDELTYQWYYSKNGGETWVKATAASAKTAAYTVNARNDLDGYLYYCVVTDVRGNQVWSVPACLTIYNGPQINVQPADILTVPGSVIFSVDAEGVGLTYQWYYSKNGGETWVKATAATAKTANYTVNARYDISGYLYRCTITDSYSLSVTTDVAALTVRDYSQGLSYSDNGDGTCTLTGIGNCTDTVIMIPPQYNNMAVVSIGYSAFEGCSGLTSVTIPDSVMSIGQEAFYYCTGLTSIDIPDSVTVICPFAFEGCSGLTSIVIPEYMEFVDFGAFRSCTGLTSVILPDSPIWIGRNAFAYCTGLTSVTIPDSVTGLEDFAFLGCSNLKTVAMGDPLKMSFVGSDAFLDCDNLEMILIDWGDEPMPYSYAYSVFPEYAEIIVLQVVEEGVPTG